MNRSTSSERGNSITDVATRLATVLIALLPEIAAAVTGAAVVQWAGWGGVAFMVLFVVLAELIYPLHTRSAE